LQFWERIDEMPRAVRPPFYGMFAVYALMLVKARYLWPVVLLAAVLSGPEAWLQAVWILIGAGLAGFCGGSVFAVVRPLTRRLGKAAAFITGWLSTFAYVVVVFWLIGSRDPSNKYHWDFSDRTPWIAAAVAALIFGSVVAAFLIDIAPVARHKKLWIQRNKRPSPFIRDP
jgi:hypothetical protein